MHWLTKPGTSLPEEIRITDAGRKELRAIPGVRNFGAHIGQALLADEVVGVDFGENWISVDPEADYDATLAAIQEMVDGYPGLYRDVQTYLKERIREVLTGASEAIVVRISGADLEVLREKAERGAGRARGRRGPRSTSRPELRRTCRRSRSRSTSRPPDATGSSPATSGGAPPTLVAGHRGRGHLRGRPGLRRERLEHAGGAQRASTSIRSLPIDTPGGGAGAPGRGRRRRRRADAERDPARERVRRIDVSANVDGPRPRLGRRDVETRLAEVELPTRVPRRDARRVRRAAGRPAAGC